MSLIREVQVSEIKEAVAKLCLQANTDLPDDVNCSLKEYLGKEESDYGKSIILDLLENAKIAKKESLPMCQDTGITLVFIELGVDVHLDGDIYQAVNEGVKQGYTVNYLRKSIVSDPVFDRKNTGDNTPAVVHLSLVPGNKIKISVAPKGAGSENMSAVAMLTPSVGIEGVRKFVVETAIKAGANACPPMAVIGVGIGGTMERAAFLAKKALIRPMGECSAEPRYAKFEQELLAEINEIGIKLSTSGKLTAALDVHIEWEPCHMASLPVAVSIQCNAARHKSTVI